MNILPHRILGGGEVEPFYGKYFLVEMSIEEQAVPGIVATNGGRADVDTADGSLGEESQSLSMICDDENGLIE